MCSIGSVVFYDTSLNIQYLYSGCVKVISSGMHRKVNSVIIQRCSTTCLVTEPRNAYSIGVGL